MDKNFEIDSEWQECRSSQEELFSFLSQLQNLEKVLPKDKIEKFECIEEGKCRFEISGLIPLVLYIKEKNKAIPYIEYASEPFNDYYLILKAQFHQNKSKIILSGYLNKFILSMASKKLKALVERINQELSLLKINQDA